MVAPADDLAGVQEGAGALVVGGELHDAGPVTPEEHLAALTTAGLDGPTAQFVVALDGNIRDGALAEVTGDLSRLIGRPTTPLVDGLRAAASTAG